jgi:dimethylamine monooxygenase subunit A
MSFDFDAAVTAPFRMQPGLRRLAADTPNLTPCGPGSRHQREKLAVLLCYWQQALLVREGFDEVPALVALAQHAAREHPAHWQWDGRVATALGVRVALDGEWATLAPGRFGTGDEVGRCLAGLPPRWRLAALLALCFEDDLALVDGRDASIPWLAVALPSHWAPEDKVGRPFAAVHAPVADNRLLLSASDALIKLVTGGERWERFVWTITGHPRLHAHPARLDPQRFAASHDAAALAAQAWWRTERQSFIPLAMPTPMAAFTIRVGITPLASALADPQRAHRVHEAVASMSEAVLDYRGLKAVREPLLAWLQARAEGRV